MGKKLIILAGKKYGKLTVIKEVAPHISTYRLQRKVLCICECGNEASVVLNSLRTGNTISCGCYGAKKSITHGLKHHTLYKVMNSMKSRCYNPNAPNYKWYGEKGINICDEWRNDFKTFYDWAIKNGWKKGLQIDRIDNNKGYFPDNCRFTTPRINTLNKQISITNTSGYQGISFHKRYNTWESRIGIRGKHLYLGHYTTKKGAVEARNNYIIKNNLEHEYRIQSYRED